MRNPNWPEKLAAIIEQRLLMPFKWGSNDCVTFAADCIREMIGKDPAAAFRSKYKTGAGALKQIREVAKNLEAATECVVGELGFTEINVKCAQRGDLVLYDDTGGPVLGIVAMNGQNGLFPGLENLRAVPLFDCRRAWRVV